MTDKIQVNSNSIGLPALLLVLFIGLKLGNVIAWSWWWVLSPLWIPFALAIAFLGIAFLIVGIMGLFAMLRGSKRNHWKKML